MKIIASKLSTIELDRLSIERIGPQAIASALFNIAMHYDSNGGGSKPLKVSLLPLIKAFPYIPHRGDVYRLLSVQAADIDTSKLQVGDSVRIHTAPQDEQSWTTSVRIAERIFNDLYGYNLPANQTSKGSRWAIVRLTGSVKELMNWQYLDQVVKRIDAATKSRNWTQKFRVKYDTFNRDHVVYTKELLKQFKFQDEVIILVPGNKKVQVTIEKLLDKK